MKGLAFPLDVKFRHVLVTGPPGAGKSTLIRQIGGWSEEGYLDLCRPRWWTNQALAIRPAFLGLTAVWQEEVRLRANRLPELRTLQVPTKIIFGVVDPYLTANLAREFHDLLPNSELHLIENAGHYVQLDAPEAVAAAILSPWPSS